MTSLLTRTTWRWIVSWTSRRAQMKPERCFDLSLSSFMGLSLSTHTLTKPPCCLCADGDLISGEMVQPALWRLNLGAEGWHRSVKNRGIWTHRSTHTQQQESGKYLCVCVFVSSRRLRSVSRPPPSRRVFVCVGLLPAPSSSRFTAPLTALHRATFLWSCTLHTHTLSHSHTHTPCSCGQAKPLTVCLMLNRSSWLAVVFLPITPFSSCVHLFNYCLLFLFKDHIRDAPSYRSIWIFLFYNYRFVCFHKTSSVSRGRNYRRSISTKIGPFVADIPLPQKINPNNFVVQKCDLTV